MKRIKSPISLTQICSYFLYSKTLNLVKHSKSMQKHFNIDINDYIIFENINDRSDKIKAKVTNLYPFKSFKELYSKLDLLKCGYTQNNVKEAKYTDMIEYYSLEQQKDFGVLGIELKLVK